MKQGKRTMAGPSTYSFAARPLEGRCLMVPRRFDYFSVHSHLFARQQESESRCKLNGAVDFQTSRIGAGKTREFLKQAIRTSEEPLLATKKASARYSVPNLPFI
jgi:hypothetical protein